MLLAAALGGSLPLPVRAAQEAPVPIRLGLEPMPAPLPALRYLLMHERTDQVPGNAALAYQRAAQVLTGSESWQEQREQWQKWLELPLAELPTDAVRQAVARNASGLQEVAKATRYERCDWGIPIRQEGMGALLPHLSKLRAAAHGLALEIRLHTKEGKHAEAIAGLRAGFTLAQHVGEGETLIEGLVGIAIAKLMCERLEEFIQQPGAPNLYWALTDLPPAYLNLWHATRWERCFLYVHLPVLAQARTGPVTAADLRQALLELRKITGDSGSVAAGVSEDDRALLTTAAIGWTVYPKAIEYLRAQGRSAEDLAALPVAQAIATYVGEGYAIQRDNLFKWFGLPYPEARRGLVQAERDLQAAIAQDPIGTLLPRLLLPALSNAATRFAEFDRQLALLRCLEAIRLHAAAHRRRLPATLDEIQLVPVPRDPMTGEAFGYRLEGHEATLEARALSTQDPRTRRTYVLTLRP